MAFCSDGASVQILYLRTIIAHAWIHVDIKHV